MSPQIQTGYAIIESDGGRPAPSGLAMVGFRQNGVLVSEAGVAASAPIRFGRIYAEIQATVKTGLGLANPNDEAAVVVFNFTDRNGTMRPGSTTIPPKGQIAALLNESPFNGGASLSGSFTFVASVPVAVAAIRGRTNERGEWLMTTVPVTDLGTPPLQQSEVLPHFAAGGGWTTEIVLVNRTDSVAKGTVRFRGPSGQSAIVRVGASTSDTFTYAVAPGASEVLRAIGATANIQTGSVMVLPEPNTTPPTGFAIFSYEDGGVITQEVGVPAAAPGTAFRLYAEAIGEFGSAGSIQTALAVANPSANDTTVTLELHNLNGSSTGLLGSLRVPAIGQTALFLNQVPGFRPLPAGFQGVLRVSATTPISVISLRARHNERGDLLMAAMPPVPEGAASASKLFFPHIVDSGGYTTELILFSANSGQAATGVLRFVSQSGMAWNLSIRPAGPADSNTGAPLEPRGLRLKTDKATPGYVLFSPLASDTTYLVDNYGKAVRTWISDLLPSAWVYMKDNGHIVRGGKETNAAGIGGGGQGGRFQEFTFDGELVWDFSFNDEKHLPHHDAVILPNGNVLAIVWEAKTAEEARKASRREGFIPQRGLWPDMLVEFEPQPPNGAKIVWEWHSWDHLIQNVNPQLDNYGNPADHPERINVNGDLIGTTTPPQNPTSDMFHTNSVAYNFELDQILLSVLRFNEVWVIDHSTTTEQARGRSGGRSGKGGDLLYRWGNPQAYGRGVESDRRLGFQHDARWIPAGRPGAGNITVFSNRTPGPAGEQTKVYEIVPPVDAGGHYVAVPDRSFGPAGPVWTYSAESLEAGNVSGAERLANGLTLISSGPQGRIFEITPAGEIVWEYWSPYSDATGTSVFQGANAFILFRAVRIPADHPALAGRRLQALDPQPP